jgi:hypothetical protein
VFYVATTHTTTRKRTWIRSKERTIDRYTWDTPAALDQTRFNYYVVSVVILTTHTKKGENRPLLPSRRQVPGHPFPHTARRNTSFIKRRVFACNKLMTVYVGQSVHFGQPHFSIHSREETSKYKKHTEHHRQPHHVARQ